MTTTSETTTLATQLRMLSRAHAPSPLLQRLKVVAVRRTRGSHAEDRPLAKRLLSRLERLERLRRTRIQQAGRAQAA